MSGGQRFTRCLAFATALAAAAPLCAQTRQSDRFEVSVGTVWLGETGLGSSDATETTPTGSPSRLFSTTSTLTGKAGVSGRAGVRVWRQLEAEAFATYAKPPLATQVSNDAEGSSPLTVSETLQQYTVGGGGLWYLPYGRRSASRWRPYVGASAAYLRQLHQGKTLAVTGRVIDFGGGAKYWLVARPTKSVKGVGVRGDVRISAATNGVGFDSRTRYAPSLSASLFVRF